MNIIYGLKNAEKGNLHSFIGHSRYAPFRGKSSAPTVHHT